MEPTSKVHELTLKNIQTRIDYPADLMNYVYKQMKKFGFINDKKPSRQQVIEFHTDVCLQNDDWPENAQYVQVYKKCWKFFEENGMFSKSDFFDTIRELSHTFEVKPEPQKPKPKPPVPDQDQARGSIEKWSPEQLLNTWKMINAMYDTEMIRKRLNSEGGNVFTKKVFDELQKRGLLTDYEPEELSEDPVV